MACGNTAVTVKFFNSLATAAHESNDRSLQKTLLDTNEELHDVIKVLELIDTASRLVSDQTLTLHLVVPTRLQLIKGIQRQAGEIEPVRSLKLRLQQPFFTICTTWLSSPTGTANAAEC